MNIHGGSNLAGIANISDEWILSHKYQVFFILLLHGGAVEVYLVYSYVFVSTMLLVQLYAYIFLCL